MSTLESSVGTGRAARLPSSIPALSILHTDGVPPGLDWQRSRGCPGTTWIHNTIQYNTIKTLVLRTMVDYLLETEVRAITRRAKGAIVLYIAGN